MPTLLTLASRCRVQSRSVAIKVSQPTRSGSTTAINASASMDCFGFYPAERRQRRPATSQDHDTSLTFYPIQKRSMPQCMPAMTQRKPKSYDTSLTYYPSTKGGAVVVMPPNSDLRLKGTC